MQFVRAGEAEPETFLAGESAAPVAEQASSPPRTTRVSAAAHAASPVRVVGSRIQLEGLNARIGEVISRLEEIAERLATIEGHLAAGGPPAARAPRKPPARKPKPPAAQPPGADDPAGGEAEQD
jgi:phage tail tape-measure protein